LGKQPKEINKYLQLHEILKISNTTLKIFGDLNEPRMFHSMGSTLSKVEVVNLEPVEIRRESPRIPSSKSGNSPKGRDGRAKIFGELEVESMTRFMSSSKSLPQS
jgi:hypothetical protein